MQGIVSKFFNQCGKMKKSKILMLAAAMGVAAVAAVSANPVISPKQRVEREFRQLETALASCMYEEVLPSPEIEFMNRALYDFMRDNPGVTRILRVNAGGYTVNDVSAESPRSAPPRSVTSQRWFQHVSQGKTPYYSMDVDSEGQIVLFYGWPLTASNGGEAAFTGAYAAMIDFAAQVALIDGAPPFRVAYQGRVVFEHEWDDLDYDEEPLAVKGGRDLTIRTLKPLGTRLDPQRQAQGASGGASKAGSKQLSGSGGEADGGDGGPEPAGKKARGGGHINKILFALMLAIALMLGYSVFGDKIARFVVAGMEAGRKNGAAAQPAPPAPPAQQPQQNSAPQQPAAPPKDALPPQPVIAKVVTESPKTEKELREMTEKMAKMADLVRKKMDTMEKRIEALAGKVEAMEKKSKSK
jgi:flagellar basal body-associated protein FliL